MVLQESGITSWHKGKTGLLVSRHASTHTHAPRTLTSHSFWMFQDKVEIDIKMTALTRSRVRLDFVRGRAMNSRAPLEFLRDVTFAFPPPVVGDTLSRLRGRDPSIEPPAYFGMSFAWPMQAMEENLRQF